MNPDTTLVTGVVGSARVEDGGDSLMQNSRWLDKLMDELAKGNVMEKNRRAEEYGIRRAGRRPLLTRCGVWSLGLSGGLGPP